MNREQRRFALRASVVAVQAGLVAMATTSLAQAEEPSALARELIAPTSVVEVGLGYVTDNSFKFGEYNGLNDKGPFGIFNFDVRGGAPYQSADPTRWRINGTDIGLDNREVQVRYARQGSFRLDFGYSEIPHNISDSYQTPFLGNGTNNLVLPLNWQRPIVPQVSATAVNNRALSPTTGLASALVNGVLTPPTAAQQAIVNNIIANDVPDFHNLDIATKRTRYDGGIAWNIDPNWEFKASARHETKDGMKLLGTVSSQVSEFSAVIPDLIDQTTDQYNVSLTWSQPKVGFAQIAYYGSVFRNNVGSMTWTDINDPTKTATMSSAPSNDFHQILLTGGYNFTPATKLVLFGSYARNTQDDQFITAGQNNQFPLGLPASSLGGLVYWKAFNAKLTSRPVKDWSFVAAYKFDDRDNHTPVNTYFFQDANEARAAAASAFNAPLGLAPNTLGSNINIYANRPYSKKLNQVDLNAEWFAAQGHAFNFGYQYQDIDRNCPGSWIDCADAPHSHQNTLKAEWRSTAVENLSSRISYEYAQRRVDYDENAFLALVPMANVVPVVASGAQPAVSVYQYLQQTGLTGFGPVAGYPATPLTGDAAIYSPNNNIVPQALYGSRNNINEEVGMRRFNMADRNRNKLRAMLNWDATDALSLQASLDYNHDDYTHSVYGLTGAKSWALNLEAGYAVNDSLSLSAYYSYEDIRSQTAGTSYGSNTNATSVNGSTIVSGGCWTTVADRNVNVKVDPCNNWGTDMRDKVDTVGVGLRQKGLAAGRLDLGGDLVWTYARTDIGVSGGSYVNNPLAVAGTIVNPAVLFIPAAGMPTVTTNELDLRLSGIYSIDKSSAVRLLYWFQRLHTADYAYQGMQYGTVTAVLPSNEQTYDYNVHVIGLSYVYHWQ